MRIVSIALLLLSAAAPIIAQTPEPAPAPAESWSWCVTDAIAASGPVRYFSDPFEGGAEGQIDAAFAEYVRNTYAARDGTRDFKPSCHTDDGLPASQASLRAAMAAKPGIRDVATAWRFHFE
jgi:hypothetical protein